MGEQFGIRREPVAYVDEQTHCQSSECDGRKEQDCSFFGSSSALKRLAEDGECNRDLGGGFGSIMNEWYGDEREQVLMGSRKQLAWSDCTPITETEEMWNQEDGCNVYETETS